MKLTHNLTKLVFTTLLLLSATAAHADSQKILTVTDDQDSNQAEVDALSNAGVLTGIAAAGKNYTTAQVAGGVVMTQKGNYKVLILQGTVNSAQEGTFTIKYLTNGLFGSYSSCNFTLIHDGQGWYVQNAYTGREVTTMKVLTNSLGVTTLDGICPEQN